MYECTKYYIVYEVIIYWKNENKELKSFYKIGLIKVENQTKQLNYRFRTIIRNGLKVYVVNQMMFHDYYVSQEAEELLLEIAHKEHISENIKLGLALDPGENDYARVGDLSEYLKQFSFAGQTEVFRTPERFNKILLKLDLHFDENQVVYYPNYYNRYLFGKFIKQYTIIRQNKLRR